MYIFVLVETKIKIPALEVELSLWETYVAKSLTVFRQNYYDVWDDGVHFFFTSIRLKKWQFGGNFYQDSAIRFRNITKRYWDCCLFSRLQCFDHRNDTLYDVLFKQHGSGLTTLTPTGWFTSVHLLLLQVDFHFNKKDADFFVMVLLLTLNLAKSMLNFQW